MKVLMLKHHVVSKHTVLTAGEECDQLNGFQRDDLCRNHHRMTLESSPIPLNTTMTRYQTSLLTDSTGDSLNVIIIRDHPSIYDVHTGEVRLKWTHVDEGWGSALHGWVQEQLDPTDVILSSSHAFLVPEFRPRTE